MIYIEDYPIPYRGDCPECGGLNTFTIAEFDNRIYYQCFRASCKLRGSKAQKISIDKIKKDNVIKARPFNIADYEFINPLSNTECVNYINRFHLLQPYIDGLITLRYDPRQHRCVFGLKDVDNELAGFTGRALSNQLPKWYIYPNSKSRMFVCKNKNAFITDKITITEDAASATRISEWCSSIALCGTSFNSTLFKYIDNKGVYIALDDDATDKAIKLQSYLSYFTKAEIIPLQKDLKYSSDEELDKIFNKNKKGA